MNRDLLKRLEKKVISEEKFINLSDADKKRFSSDYRFYIAYSGFYIILKLTKDFLNLFENGHSYLENVAIRLILEKLIYCKYILNIKDNYRFNVWWAEQQSRELEVLKNILKAITLHGMQEDKVFANRKYLIEKIKEKELEINSFLSRLEQSGDDRYKKIEYLKMNDMVNELDRSRKEKIFQYAYYVVCQNINRDVHGSARSVEYLMQIDKKDSRGNLEAVLFANNEIFKIFKKYSNTVYGNNIK